jgi:hypothetical protein
MNEVLLPRRIGLLFDPHEATDGGSCLRVCLCLPFPPAVEVRPVRRMQFGPAAAAAAVVAVASLLVINRPPKNPRRVNQGTAAG